MEASVFAQIRDILAKLYPDQDSIRRICDDSGIEIMRVILNSTPQNNWHAVLREADLNDQMETLLNIVKNEYWQYENFRRVYIVYHNQYTHVELEHVVPIDDGNFENKIVDQIQVLKPLTRENFSSSQISGLGKQASSVTKPQPLAKQQSEIETFTNYCTQLEKLLRLQKWREADQETNNVILIIAKKQGQILSAGDIKSLPVVAIQVVDNLWKRHSNNHFGFSAQKQIWSNLTNHPTKIEGKSRDRFAEKVGWCVQGSWIREYDNFTFSLDALEGHLPLLRINVEDDDPSWWVNWKRYIDGFLLFMMESSHFTNS